MRDPSLSRSQLDSGSAFSPGRPFQSFGQALQYLSYRLTYFLLSHPYPFRIVFAVLRHVRPIATFGSMVMVSKASDVREVLDRLDDFTLNEILGAKMPWGPFLLTIDPPEQHARERQILESVVFRDADVQRIRRLAADRCSDIIKTKQADGEVDVVADLCDDIIVDLISSYFGIPVIDDKKSMARILGDVAGYILAEPPADSEPWVRSHDSMAKLTKAVVAQIERRAREHAAAPAAPAPEDDLLTRLVKVLCSGRGPAWLDQDWIRRYVTGLAATGGATIVRATTHAMDQLIAHPVGLQTARQLAAQIQTGRDADTDRRRLLGTIFEALRASGRCSRCWSATAPARPPSPRAPIAPARCRPAERWSPRRSPPCSTRRRSKIPGASSPTDRWTVMSTSDTAPACASANTSPRPSSWRSSARSCCFPA